MAKARYAVIGAGGWRAGYFLEAAKALPDRFESTGMLVRDAEKGQALSDKWAVPATQSLDELLAAKPDFVIVSVSRGAAAGYIEELAVRRGVGVLCETPPAQADLAEMNHLWSAIQPALARGVRVQVAEQYPYQPMHAARIAVAASGRLGPLTHAQVSISHGYHAAVLIRRLLGVGIGPVTVNAQRFVSKILQGPGRGGPPAEEKLVDVQHTIATLQFENGTTALFDFAGDQHRSWIRSPRVIVRGQRGEVHDDVVRTLIDHRTPVIDTLRRVDTGHDGNMEGYAHRGVLLGGQWLYQNPFGGARLSDEEIAVAHVLEHMAAHVAGGLGFYSLAEALHDHYIGMLIEDSVKAHGPVSTEPQSWMVR